MTYPNIIPGLSDTLTTPIDGNGRGQVRISNQNSTTLWIVRQISVLVSPAVDGPICRLTLAIGIIDTAYFAGRGDSAGGDPPIYLRPGDFIDASFEQVPIGSTGFVTYYYDEVPL